MINSVKLKAIQWKSPALGHLIKFYFVFC
jgi:hypothetical protein